MRALYNWLLPKYVRFPLLLVVLVNAFVYYLPGRLIGGSTTYDLSISLDGLLPTLPFFIVIYVLAYVQWGGGYIFHCRTGVKMCYQMAMADLIAKLLCFVLFVFLPTRINRADLVTDSFFANVTQFFYNIDEPINLFPSIHCLESYMCFRTAMMLQKKNTAYIATQGIFAVLVFLSTVFIKQHFIVDIFAGIAVCEVGIILSTKFNLWRMFRKVQLPSAKRYIEENNLIVE